MMSTHEIQCELPSSADCSTNNGVRAIQRGVSRTAEVGGIPVIRLLPSRRRRMVGAWCFLDHARAAAFTSGSGLSIGPHPHIGLQIFIRIIAGDVFHRDSMGNVQVIRPGQVNLMTAGDGITHTEESLPAGALLHAVQLWIALPAAERDRLPMFDHYAQFPQWQVNGFELTLLVGSFGPYTAPARTFSPLVGLDLAAKDSAGTQLALEPRDEHGVLPLTGQWNINVGVFGENEFAYLGRGMTSLNVGASAGARAVLLGGEPFAEEILLWWSCVGHSKAEIDQAPCEWEEGGAWFGEVAEFDEARLVAPPLPWRA